MKKRLFIILITAISVFCLALGLAGCGDSGAKTYDISFENGDIAELSSDLGEYTGNTTLVSPIAPSEAKWAILLYDYYNADTLKVYANGVEIPWTKTGTPDSDVISGLRYKVGELEYPDISKDTVFTFSADEIKINIKFELAESRSVWNSDTETFDVIPIVRDSISKQMNYLNSFKLNDSQSTTLTSAIDSATYAYSASYKKIYDNNGIIITSDKKYGFYNDSIFFDMKDADSNYLSFYKQADESLNKYYLSFSQIKKDITVVVDPVGMEIGKYTVVNNTGYSLYMAYDNALDDFDYFSSQEFDANKTTNVAFKLYIPDQAQSEVDLSLCEIYINDKKAQWDTSSGEHICNLTVSYENSPINYLNKPNTSNYDSYIITVKKITVQENAPHFSKLVGATSYAAFFTGEEDSYLLIDPSVSYITFNLKRSWEFDYSENKVYLFTLTAEFLSGDSFTAEFELSLADQAALVDIMAGTNMLELIPGTPVTGWNENQNDNILKLYCNSVIDGVGAAVEIEVLSLPAVAGTYTLTVTAI